MIDFIQKETKKILVNCCSKYAKERGLNIENVQIVLGLNEEGDTYIMCENYIPKEEYDIMQVLGVRIDFLGYSKLAPPFIVKALVSLAEKNNIPFESVKILCVPFVNEKGKNDLELFLYKGFSEYIETISMEDLFTKDGMEIPNM